MTQIAFSKRLAHAIQLKKEKDYENAWHVFQELAASNPKSSYFWGNFAHLAFLMKRLNEARQYAETALALAPHDEFLRSIYVQILLAQKELEKALPLATEVLTQKFHRHILRNLFKLAEQKRKLPLLDNLFLELESLYRRRMDFLQIAAEFYHRLGQKEKALAIYQKLVAARPDDDFIYNRFIDLKIEGLSLQERIRHLENLLKIPSRAHNVHLLGLLAREYRKAGQLEKAEPLQQRILQLAPSNLFQRKQMGFTHLKKKDWDTAVHLLQDCLLEDPDDVYVRNALLKAFRGKGDKQGALELIQKILVRYPDKKQYYGIRRKVEKWEI